MKYCGPSTTAAASMPPFQIDRDGSQTTEPFIGSAPGLMRSELTLYGPLAESLSALPCNSVVGELACCQFVPALIVMTAAPRSVLYN